MAGERVRPIRRVITGHDASGRSVVEADAIASCVMIMAGTEDFAVTDLWRLPRMPADNTKVGDPCTLPITLAPPAGGAVLRIVQFPPDRNYVGKWDPGAGFASLGDSGAQAIDHAGPHEAMHRTQSVDFALVMEGEIWSVLDTDERPLRAGDVLIQRGTNHAWSNRSDAMAIVAFVLIDALPIVRQR